MRSSVLKTFFLAVFLALFSLPQLLSADTIFISPLTGSYATGETFSVRIMVSSPRQAINAISGVLTYPIDKLQVTSISKIGSVLSLWVQEPSFSNSRGTVTFEGVVPNPGFQESNGRVLAVNFRVVGTGPAEVKLTSGSLLANDGLGTNVLKTLGAANFTLEQREVLPVTPPAVIETGEDTAGPKPVPTPVQKAPEPKKVSIEFPAWSAIYEWISKILSFLIPLVALLYLFLQTFHRGNSNVRKLRKTMRRDLHSIDRIVEKAFDIFREDMSDIIHMLERTRSKRKLTSEENAIIHRLRQNLVDTEKVIQAEISHAEKDVGD